ncbi:S100 calcium binding protein W [Lampris incognitus]|uniref:S100 calcium binding protein W n=1 Tax=Lampris incognitus TaxID=2546036 RepID=UPI0024B6279D|nr:S100 calcium binding protein W [Lampris incognitus]XP_056142517.1 S100 calcium binding protein W [Lampris incognitus]
MPHLEQVIVSMVEMFEEYANEGGKKHPISMNEFKEVLEKELEAPGLKEKIHADDVREAVEMLDKNHDGEVNFREFSRCVAVLAKGYYKQKRGKGSKKAKGKEGDQED